MWEVSWRLNRTATYWPSNSSGYSSIYFPFSWAAQQGAWRPSLCWDMVFIPASSLQLIWTSCRRGYIIILRPPTSCERHICTQFNPLTIKVVPWSPDIFDRMHLLFTQVHFSSNSPAGSEFNMLPFLLLRCFGFLSLLFWLLFMKCVPPVFLHLHMISFYPVRNFIIARVYEVFLWAIWIFI